MNYRMAVVNDNFDVLDVNYKEIFRKVNGFDRYLVSNHGNLWDRKKAAPVKQYTNSAGYPHVSLHNGSTSNLIPVHRIVAQAFLGDVAGLTVDHLDHDRANNHVTNLEIVTQAENNRRRRPAKRRNDWFWAVDMETGQILGKWKSKAQAARDLEIHPSAISHCLAGTFKHAKGIKFEYVWGEQ